MHYNSPTRVCKIKKNFPEVIPSDPVKRGWGLGIREGKGREGGGGEGRGCHGPQQVWVEIDAHECTGDPDEIWPQYLVEPRKSGLVH